MQKITRYVAALIVALNCTQSGVCFDQIMERIVMLDDGQALVVAETSEPRLVRFRFGDARTMDGLWENAEASLRRHVVGVGRVAKLTDEQKARLELAGYGDISRFMDDVRRVVPENSDGSMTVEQWQQIQEEIFLLQERYRTGLHGDGSLLRKVLRATLSAEQLSALLKREHEIHRQLIKRVVSSIDRTMNFTADEREQILTLVMEQTEAVPPYQSLPDHSRNDVTIVQQQMAGMESDLKPIVGESRWPRMERIIQTARDVRRAMNHWELAGGVVFVE